MAQSIIRKKTDNWFSRQDPRNKMSISLIVSLLIFITKSQNVMNILTLILFSLMLTAGLYQSALKFAAGYVILDYLGLFIVALVGLTENMLLSAPIIIIFFTKIFIPIFMATFLLINTTEVTELIVAMENMKMPREVTIPLAVMLRFIPSLLKEINYIRDAMKIRGIRLGIGHPIRSMEYLLVPLLMRTLKISDELSASAMTRGIDYPGKKTHYKEIRFGFKDAIFLLAIITVTVLIIILV